MRMRPVGCVVLLSSVAIATSAATAAGGSGSTKTIRCHVEAHILHFPTKSSPGTDFSFVRCPAPFGRGLLCEDRTRREGDAHQHRHGFHIYLHDLKQKKNLQRNFAARPRSVAASDRVRLRGVPDLELEIPGGLPGDLATAAVVVNSVPRVLAASPGLRVMSELPPPTPGPPPLDTT